ncbi:hypothetical protein H6G20_19055 [Desertifilum sp. FACHB-1129]|uniref:Uncharacterized protein n=1 Tax=Desertifilum tharense IPPAS B-1220 TaxID=1781255 RepID=A0A1E5QL70_9CYAN|nr:MULTISPECIES: hypothetical protein [Desertifilum]MDA0209963.1 hypothetical protein [Cyanobacteria bacterium FC1]MBD2313770.1 hypothetical protein [Desertifilum sp. FACHB-1129]MBD2324520.1 hypothetical protein [Desertifilum sp. FACHB-866]MBD2334534.1 hypothetical protein [Desertifilum sp. FACHB-868]OEJ75432.1 hypothetical protein BH720_09300 [Desertifilum tharense IPPAS B-1220]
MNNGIGSPLETWQDQLQQATDSIHQLAQQSRGDAWALLHLLRSLEAVHQEIRDSVFQEALPNNRQELYNFLREIEANGGWPYVGRMKLKLLLANLEAALNEENESQVVSSAEVQLNTSPESASS